MLTDEEIAALTTAERRQLIARLMRPVDEVAPSRRWLRWTRLAQAVTMTGAAIVLVPWIAYLGISLPHRYVAEHWDVAWVGFDAVLLVLIAATAVLGYLRRQLVAVTAFGAGVLLVCDAWFDVMTAHGEDAWASLASALLVELPFAVLLIAGSLQMLRMVAARLWVADPKARAWQIPVPLPEEGDRAVRRRRRSHP